MAWNPPRMVRNWCSTNFTFFLWRVLNQSKLSCVTYLSNLIIRFSEVVLKSSANSYFRLFCVCDWRIHQCECKVEIKINERKKIKIFKKIFFIDVIKLYFPIVGKFLHGKCKKQMEFFFATIWSHTNPCKALELFEIFVIQKWIPSYKKLCRIKIQQYTKFMLRKYYIIIIKSYKGKLCPKKTKFVWIQCYKKFYFIVFLHITNHFISRRSYWIRI